MNKLAIKYADWLVKNGKPEEHHDVYVYGFECFLHEIIIFTLVFIIAFLIGRPLEMFVFQAFWMPFRINLGGLHAKSHITCSICSISFAIACVLLIPFI